MPPPPPFTGPQQVLEQAVVNALRAAEIPGLPEKAIDRTFAGQPHPRAGNRFAAVWSGGGRRSQLKTCSDEVFSVSVTVTVRCVQPADRWVLHRDELEVLVNTIRALIHQDIYNNSISNAANVLANYNQADTPVGFYEGLWCQSIEDVRDVGPDWFHAHVDSPGTNVGMSQRIVFGGARRTQNIPTMT
jgi:hypothetical protein